METSSKARAGARRRWRPWSSAARQGRGLGDGWVDDQTVNPATGAVNEKVPYVLALPGDLLLGCGVYKV